MPRTTADPEFGPLITRRGTSLIVRLVPIPLGFFALVFMLSAVVNWLGVQSMRPGSGQAAMRQDAQIMTAIGVATGIVTLIVILLGSRTVEFYEHGAIVRRLGLVRTRLAYRDLVKHRYRRVHLRRYGAYAGSHVLLTLRDRNARKVFYHAPHKQQMIGTNGLFSREYQMHGSDPIDDVSKCAALFITRQWMARLSNGESIEWHPRATLTPEGIASWSGSAKGTIALYSEIVRVTCNSKQAMIFTSASEPFITLPTGDVNVLPGLYLVNNRRSPLRDGER